jgi:hypothetical protein
MASLEDVNEAIAQNAADGIKKQKVGNEETEIVSIADQIAAANHLAAQQNAARANPFRVRQIEMHYR